MHTEVWQERCVFEQWVWINEYLKNDCTYGRFEERISISKSLRYISKTTVHTEVWDKLLCFNKSSVNTAVYPERLG